jgi:phospholipase/carboxylesterase
MIADLQDLAIGDWTLKLHVPATGSRVIFMVHGWTGDENSMWVFAQRMPKDALLIAPRAPYVSKHSDLAGYSWVEERASGFSTLEMFEPAVQAFGKLVEQLTAKYSEADFSSFDMVGFSQGSAFSAAYAMRNPSRVGKLAMLAGFLPEQSGDALTALAGKPVFIAHGTKDETVPIERARNAREQLGQVGAKVQYCESEIGHKLGANCFSELAAFFA